jgi:hypothetical protein
MKTKQTKTKEYPIKKHFSELGKKSWESRKAKLLSHSTPDKK